MPCCSAISDREILYGDTADEAGLDPSYVMALVDHVIGHLLPVRDALLEDIGHPFLSQLCQSIEERAQKRADLMN
jgi:hypothetical protein